MNAQTNENMFQAIVGESSFSIILPRGHAVNLGIAKGDFVKVRQEESRIVIEKSNVSMDRRSLNCQIHNNETKEC
jgi:bifunctional DNA-binding transcriptional regulator/antitoxin component of YhaV-PrlF toxin-antitoxin module